MDYESVIKDFANGVIRRDFAKLVIDNDGGYWSYSDPSLSEEENENMASNLDDKYGAPDGYGDVVDILNAAGVKAEWC